MLESSLSPKNNLAAPPTQFLERALGDLPREILMRSSFRGATRSLRTKSPHPIAQIIRFREIQQRLAQRLKPIER
jgi:hypothetical protein